MKPALLHLGESRSPVVVIDDFSGDAGAIVDIAAALAPFPPCVDTSYPGLRRFISVSDGAADAYVERTLRAVAPFIGGAFGFDAFDFIEASFSMVTTPPAQLAPPQRAPHFDSSNPRFLALLHYLGGADGAGTAFYRQRATSLERISEDDVDRFIASARTSIEDPPAYFVGSNRHYEEIGRVDGVVDRLIIYQGCLLHSGVIPASTPLSDDPRRGRLTANLFVRGHD